MQPGRLLRRFTLLGILIAGVLLPMFTPTMRPTRTAQAQGDVVSQVLAIVSRNLGISPAPTRGQLDLGGEGLAFPMEYSFSGLDLRDAPLSCTSRVMAEDETIIGNVGYRVVVEVLNRRYEYRTNATGSQVIRCASGQQVDNNFGIAPAVGASQGGAQLVDRAFAHLQNYLDLGVTLNIQNAENPPEDYPRVFYRWDAVVFRNSALECPAQGATFTNGDIAGYRITLTVNGRRYRYHTRADGGVLVLCLGGRADPSSIGIGTTTSE